MPGMLSMAGGLPAPDLFPVAELTDAVDAVLREEAAAALQYGPVAGVPAMREWIAQRSGETGARTDPSRVLVTSGSQQGLDLLARSLLTLGDVVALDDPSYLGAVQIFRTAGAELAAVPSDEDGMDTDALAALLRGGMRCRLVYVVPHFHNPTGGVLSLRRRRHLAELAERYGFLIVEDDPYADLSFDGVRLPSIDQHTDQVVRLLSLSKTLCPGFRVAGLCGPATVVASVTSAKQRADLQTNTFGQHVLARLLARPGFLAAHLDRLQRHYQARARRLARLLMDRVPWLAFPEPTGGLFFWCTITSGVHATELWRACAAAGVAVVPGEPFRVERDSGTNLRLSYATLTADEASTAVDRLAAAHTQLARAAG
ncbi:PLP-dependent aminotransferase family protein [Actinophytocola sp.]|uniref:aminotransferase-like domain-containing protein n=1 Tax=Actinophytocola sp. TaxID=1872138 RepID=UPI003D6BAC82